MTYLLEISNINKLINDNRQENYWQSINEPDVGNRDYGEVEVMICDEGLENEGEPFVIRD
ncbi:MAG TPA: hypothetical protein VNO50_14920 [Pyrinomonadaceae bacterium]|nr:hypothetical protein [Pyrinomonadaceae bacterium]